MDPSSRATDDQRPPAEPSEPKPTRRIRSSDLFGEAHEIQIEHAGETYRLRMTRSGKLILTK